jgi:hypothetical protein
MPLQRLLKYELCISSILCITELEVCMPVQRLLKYDLCISSILCITHILTVVEEAFIPRVLN